MGKAQAQSQKAQQSKAKAVIGCLLVLPTKLAVTSVRLYRYVLSPLIPARCRYFPSCSEYAIESFRKFGFARGFFLTLHRLLRCQPWGGSGYDPVPDQQCDCGRLDSLD